jgi:ethanolamine utilization microcompartment shell protein EutS
LAFPVAAPLIEDTLSMHIIRYQDPQAAVLFGSQKPDGSALRCDGDLYGGLRETGEAAQVAELLAPLQPSQILCIGLNYRRHAEESGMKAPERPVLFTKGINTVAGPGDAIEIPVKAASHEVDYECELAAALGILETQGLTAILYATDAMLKAANVELVGKEKIGAAYVTIIIKGDVAAVKAALEAGAQAVGDPGKLIAAEVISRPHEDLLRLLPS